MIHLLYAIDFSYAIFVWVLALWSFTKSNPDFFNAINKLHDKKFILLVFLIWSRIALVSFVILAARQGPSSILHMMQTFGQGVIVGNIIFAHFAKILLNRYIFYDDRGLWK